ncbi:hypothetical protein BSYN_25160 [Bacteroides sedimenti]|uniref:Glycoside hydrolase family 88 protein n=2 Tax=Bacteroides sedimenti TaxID=2136147 RepID=A0ABN6Z6U7_9BACE
MKMRIIISFFIIVFPWQFSAGQSKKESSTQPAVVINKDSIKNTLKKVADWQIKNFTYSTNQSHDFGIDSWTNATLYFGMLQWAKIAPDSIAYYDWLTKLGAENQWKIAENFINYPKYGLYHADELCIAQTYLGLYKKFRKEEMLKSVQKRIDWIINYPPNGNMSHTNKQTWTWSDALFMAPPVFAELYTLTGNLRYIEFMDEQFKKTYNHLYDPKEKLFYRDDSYFNKQEKNGAKVFWGRGNGWVAAGLVDLLKILPKGSQYRLFYQNLFKELVPRLASLQDKNGFWHASLLDPTSYPAPETSATSLITYALAYGINEGLLDKEKFKPVVRKAWRALASAVDENGKLGWVQPIGADPKKVTKEMTSVYGVGAFLLAGTELYQF